MHFYVTMAAVVGDSRGVIDTNANAIMGTHYDFLGIGGKSLLLERIMGLMVIKGIIINGDVAFGMHISSSTNAHYGQKDRV